ncbi:radical SAM protein [Kordiimonas sp.]|uniref:radical SAM protein n=1 Tax=Kordiimonas sp. TaxID=1970157 RepID=UPI003B51E330
MTAKYINNLSECPTELGRVTVEVSTWCNLSCVGCIRTIDIQKNQWTNRHISVEVFRNVVANLPPAKLLVMHGIGEPLLHPQYKELVTIAAESRKFGSLHCNTNALAKPTSLYGELQFAGLTNFNVSVDSLNPVFAERTRAGTDTEKLTTRLAAFQNEGLRFGITMVASKKNLLDIPSTLQLLSEVVKCNVFIQCYIDHDDGDAGLSLEDTVLLEQWLAELRPRLPELKIYFSSKYVEKKTALPMCMAPWFDPGVTVEGYLTPCCVEWDPSVLGYQNLGKQGLPEIWHSPAFQKFLAAYTTQSPIFCRNCSEDVRANIHHGSATPVGHHP